MSSERQVHVGETKDRSSVLREQLRHAAEIKKRSVVIAGHRTSISLENAFWEDLRQIASSRATSVNQLVTEIDENRVGNLSSAIRTLVLLYQRGGL